MSELEPRKGTILRAVVVEYVTSAEPIASELLTSKYDLGVKSATVRSELSELALLGYLDQPHTSAGRIPSDLGYRYYVDHLIKPRSPDPASKESLRSVVDEGEALQSLLREAARTLSKLTHLLTAAAVVQRTNLTIKSAVFSALGPQQALLVLLLSNGHVENKLIECPPGLTLTDIGVVNQTLIEACANRPIRWLLRNKPPAIGGHAAAEKLLATLWGHMRAMVRDLTRGSLTTEGEEYLFGQPEFQRDATGLSALLDEIKNSDVLFETLATPSEQPQTVTIGKENRYHQMHRLSIVRQTFYVGETEAGTIALIGPTRMHYDAGIPLVEFTARALSESLTRFIG